MRSCILRRKPMHLKAYWYETRAHYFSHGIILITPYSLANLNQSNSFIGINTSL